MTRIIFLPGEGSLVVMESGTPAGELASAINAGDWTPPAPFFYLNPDPGSLQASRHEDIVLVTTSQPVKKLFDKALPMDEQFTLSPRQFEILAGLAEGLTARQVAFRLKISPRAVMYHIARIKAAFGSLTLAQSVSRAVSLGLCRTQNHSRRSPTGE